jgi:DUF2911 family protein
MQTTKMTAAMIVGVAVMAGAQEKPAQRETATATFDGKKVAIEYGRPALRGRTVDELTAKLPADRIWRAGENQVTTLKTDTDLMIGDQKVPAGNYSVYVHAPAQGNWALVVNSDPGVPLKQIYAAAPPEVANALWPRLDGYDKVKDKEVARATLKPGKTAAPVEQFQIALSPAGDGATMTLSWGDQTWSTDIKPAK